MIAHKAYFDGSHRESLSGCGFLIKLQNDVLFEYVKHEALPTPHVTEMRALYYLLCGIKQLLEPGNKVKIYGDAKSVIEQIKGEVKVTKKYEEITNTVIELYNELTDDYKISLNWIPKKKNSEAHKIARRKQTNQVRLQNNANTFADFDIAS